MATTNLPMESSEEINWNNSPSTFAPPNTRRVIRGWDRAPVSAHAPRLHGQKVWKKPTKQRTGKDNKENAHEAEKELEREGKGSRKKTRLIGDKQNISNAGWKDDAALSADSSKSPRTALTPKDKNQFLAPPVLSPTKISPVSPDAKEAALQFVPRKRTNTNHVITPKKVLRQSTLNRQAQRQSLLVPDMIAASPEKKERRPRKSMRKSGRKSILVNLVDEEITTDLSKDASVEAAGLPEMCVPEPDESQVSFTGSSEPSLTIQNTPQRSVEKVTEEVDETKSLRRSTRSTRSSSVFTFQAPMPSPAKARATSPVKMLFDEFLAEDSEEPPTFMSPVKGVMEMVEEVVTENDSLSETSIDPTIVQAEEDIDKSRDETLGNDEITLAAVSDETVIVVESVCSTEEPVQTAEPTLPEITTIPGVDSAKNVEELSGGLEASDEQESVHSDPNDGTALDLALEAQIVNEIFMSPKKTSAAIYEDVADSEETSSDPAEIASNSSNEVNSDTDNTEVPLDSTSENTVEVVSNTEPETTDLLIEAIASHATPSAYDHDDTDMLRNFLTRVKANKAAKEPTKRKRSLPHSPLPVHHGSAENPLSPSGLEFDIPECSPSKRHKADSDDPTEPQSIRRSSRTRLPVVKPPPGAPSFIPVRRLGQDPDTTVTLKRNEEKELAALTRVNTRKNKGGALAALDVLKKKADEKEDPAMRQRLLKEVFDERKEKGAKKGGVKGKGLSVRWAEELAQFQTLEKGKLNRKAMEVEEKEEKKEVKVKGVGFAPAPVEKEKSEEKKAAAVRVGVRSKIALGMAVNGTPAPKRKVRGKM